MQERTPRASASASARRATAASRGASQGSLGPLAFRQCVQRRLHSVPVSTSQSAESPTNGARGAAATSAMRP